MRRLLPLALVGALAACSDGKPDMTTGAKLERSIAVRTCAGYLIGRDPLSGSYVAIRHGFVTNVVVELAPGVTPEAFCGGAA